jgi:hypothetical protein
MNLCKNSTPTGRTNLFTVKVCLHPATPPFHAHLKNGRSPPASRQSMCNQWSRHHPGRVDFSPKKMEVIQISCHFVVSAGRVENCEKVSCFIGLHILTHFIDTFYLHILLAHFIDTFYLHILFTHFIDTFYWHILFTHFIYTFYLHTYIHIHRCTWYICILHIFHSCTPRYLKHRLYILKYLYLSLKSRLIWPVMWTLF